MTYKAFATAPSGQPFPVSGATSPATSIEVFLCARPTLTRFPSSHTTTAKMFRQAITRQARLFSSTPTARKSVVDSAKDVLNTVNKTVSQAAVKGIETGGMRARFCVSRHIPLTTQQRAPPKPSKRPSVPTAARSQERHKSSRAQPRARQRSSRVKQRALHPAAQVTTSPARRANWLELQRARRMS